MSLYLDIEKRFNGFTLRVQLEETGGRLGVLGSSGSGKSMTLMCIAGVVEPDSGEIVLNGKTLFSSKKQINLTPQSRKTGLMFQNYALFPNMTAFENISAGLMNRKKSDRKKIIMDYMSMFKIENLKDRYPHQLSGGQQQRVALARMMAREPDILLLDEPFSAIDGNLRSSMEGAFTTALEHFRGPVLYVSHNIDEVYKYCDNIAIMSGGRIMEQGTTDTLFRRPQTIEGARLTGCRNISAIEWTRDGRLLAKDWGITFDVNAGVASGTRCIGIRETLIRLSDEAKGPNVFEVELQDIRQMPFSTELKIRPVASQTHDEENSLVCRIRKEEAVHIKECQRDKQKIYASIENQNLLLLR